MNELIQTFNFEGSSLRIIVKDGEPWFCAVDVCKALGYSNARDALRNHTKNKGVVKHDTPTKGGVQPLVYLNEGNLYRLVMRSKLESAERFQDWVCEEVLPTIRKTGSYGAAPKVPQTLSEALRLAADIKDQKLALEAKVREDAPKVEFCDAVIKAHGDMLIREAAKTLGVRPTFLFDWLRSHDWITARNEPYSERVKQNVLRPRVSNFEHPERGPSITVTAHVTPKGLYRIYQSMLEEGLVTRNDQLEMTFSE